MNTDNPFALLFTIGIAFFGALTFVMIWAMCRSVDAERFDRKTNHDLTKPCECERNGHLAVNSDSWQAEE